MSAKILSKEEMSASEAKWVTLQKINWQDPTGKSRVWECAERKTRGKAGIDAVAVLAIIRSKTNAFPPSTCIIEQYRPPIDKIVIELPAGLVDENESPEDAAIRELKEETGYECHKVLDTTPLLVSDPGMTTANMKLVTVEVLLDNQLESPDQHLDEGEAIVRRVIALDDLNSELKSYSEKGFAVDARLSHFATGYEMTAHLKAGSL